MDFHLVIDAVNLKWTAQQKGIDAFAIASTDADFKVLVDDIRTSTDLDVVARGSPSRTVFSYTESSG